MRQQGIKVALNTGYDRATAVGLVGKVGVQIDALVTSSDVGNDRPHPDMIRTVMELTGVTDSTFAAKVGDSLIDIEEGKNAGCGKTFGITTGAQSAEQLKGANPTEVIDSLRELLVLISD